MGKKNLNRSLKINLWVMIASILVIIFNNCGETFTISNQGSQKPIDDDLNRTCEEKQLLDFEKTYHSFLRRNCVGCHISGGIGNGNFADEDPTTAFKAFSSRGYEKISAQALNDNHRPPFTGSQNAPDIEVIKPLWIKAESDFIQCLIDDGRPPKVSEAAKMLSKPIPQTLAKTFVTMTWDLETESSLKAPLIFTVEIRQAEVGGSVRGYEFRNPTLKLKESTPAQYRVRALALYFNEQLLRDVSTYINLDQVISSTQALNLAPGAAYALLAVDKVSPEDKIAWEFQSFNALASATPTATPTPTSSPQPTPSPAVVTFSQLTAPNGIFALSCVGCHNAQLASGALNLLNYQNAKENAMKIKSRVNNSLNPMPRSGLLPQAQRIQIDAWVDNGAPQ